MNILKLPGENSVIPKDRELDTSPNPVVSNMPFKLMGQLQRSGNAIVYLPGLS
jgi:hypothetical protein